MSDQRVIEAASRAGQRMQAKADSAPPASAERAAFTAAAAALGALAEEIRNLFNEQP